jgi:glycosyltransferase involved in cell wall biosynthesis
MDKFKLAVFNTQPPHLYFGGVERRIMETTKRLQTDADIAVYCGTKAGFKQPVIIENVKMVPCYSTDWIYPLDNWFFNRSLTKKEEAFEADVYEAHNVSGYGFPNALKKRHLKKSFIHVVHGPLFDEYEQALNSQQQGFRNKLANLSMHRLARLEEKTAKQASMIVAVSKYSANKILKHYKVDEKILRVIPNGVDMEKFKPAKNRMALRQQFGLGSEPCVLFVGGLVPRKGLRFLVEAAKTIVKERVDTKFLIVGDGPLKTQLSGAIASAGLLGNFVFLGALKDEELPKVYNCADVFVLPSIQEGQGIVLLEAQASAVPVVAFDVGGVKEAIRDGETGFLVTRGNVDGLSTALLKLLSDEALRERMGGCGNRLVASNFTWDICARNMLEVYKEVLNITGFR